jgi:hypothetical protein
MADVAALLEAADAKPTKPGSYKKRGAENSN